MKISEMSTDQASDVLVRIADPASNIMHDQDSIAVIEKLAKADGDSALSFIADNLVPVCTVLLKTHRKDLYEIIAALSGKSKKEIAEQKWYDTIKDIKACWDGDLASFFGSLKG